MSGVMYGADSEELERIAAELEQYEEELGQLLSQGVGSVALLGLSATLSSIWAGPRASEFAGVWQSRHLLRVRSVQSTLREAANDLRRNAAEQRQASSASGPFTGRLDGARQTPYPYRPPRLERLFYTRPPQINIENLLHNLEGGLAMADMAEFLRHPVQGVRPFYYGLMGGARFGRLAIPGLTDIGMHLSGGAGDAFNYFRSAKGGFRSAASKVGFIEEGVGLKLSIVGAAVSGGSILHTGLSEGFGSSAFAESVVDDGISAAVGFVPGGGLAYEGGKFIGDKIFHHTPVGEAMMNSHAASAHISDAEAHGATADAALRRGDFEAAQAANERERESSLRAVEESEGWKGLWNATKATVGQ